MDALLGSLQSSLELVSQHVNIHLSSIAGDSLKVRYDFGIATLSTQSILDL